MKVIMVIVIVIYHDSRRRPAPGGPPGGPRARHAVLSDGIGTPDPNPRDLEKLTFLI